MVQGLLGEIGPAIDPVHDLQRVAVARVLAGPVAQPAAKSSGLLHVAEPEQRVDRKRAVPDPRVPVVPVPLASGLLGQPGGRRGDDSAGRRVGHQLERHRRPRHHLPPAACVGRAVQPIAPESRGLVGEALYLLGRQPPGWAAHRFEHDPAGLARAQRPGRTHAVTMAFKRGPLVPQRGARRANRMQCQLQAVRLEYRPVLGQLHLVRLARVVEPRLNLHHETHRAAHHAKLPYQPVPIRRSPRGDRHEVVDLTDPVRCHESGDQDRGVREIQLLAYVVVPVGSDPEMAAAVGIEQRREHARRVEPGKTQPVHRAVCRHQRSRLQVPDQAVIADVGIAGHDAPSRP